MQKKVLLLINIIFLALCALSAWGQEEEGWVRPGSEAAREELGYAQALAPDLAIKLGVINRIGNKARAGGVSPEDKSAMQILRYLAGEGTLILKPYQSFAAVSFPEARRASCEVLGYIGGEPSREILLGVLRAESEPMVLSEAVFSLGKITTEPDAEIIQAFTALLEKKVLVSGGDNNLALALLGSIDKLADSKDGIHDENLFRTLLRMLDTSLMQNVRQRAMLLIEKLKGF
jgi:hypothetical protein